ncbi:hypothetical protein CHU98_g7873 [Xylaria longipes]|nr:hypothetical protein CHU98_g7873 [Xylaria longipes]
MLLYLTRLSSHHLIIVLFRSGESNATFGGRAIKRRQIDEQEVPVSGHVHRRVIGVVDADPKYDEGFGLVHSFPNHRLCPYEILPRLVDEWDCEVVMLAEMLQRYVSARKGEVPELYTAGLRKRFPRLQATASQISNPVRPILRCAFIGGKKVTYRRLKEAPSGIILGTTNNYGENPQRLRWSGSRGVLKLKNTVIGRGEPTNVGVNTEIQLTTWRRTAALPAISSQATAEITRGEQHIQGTRNKNEESVKELANRLVGLSQRLVSSYIHMNRAASKKRLGVNDGSQNPHIDK